MEMSVSDVARLFQVSTDTIHRWIEEDNLPATKFDDRFHFNRVGLIEWAHENRVPISVDEADDLPSLTAALERGGVHLDLPGASKNEVLKAVVERMLLPPNVDRSFLLEMLLAREKQGSTGFGGGVAIPHARNPILLRVQEPLVMLCYVHQPVDFDAMDSQPVSVLFSMIVPTVSDHLKLLAKLGRALQNESFKKILTRRAGLAEILGQVRAIEA